VTSRHDDVTVVVTNYNYGRYVEEAVASALEQRGGPPHVIVVDDGSTDPDTDAVLDRLPDAVTVHRQANAGLAAARNAGLRQASTPYLIVLDADDRLASGALDALRVPLDAARGLGFSYGITRFFGEWQGEMTMPPYDPYRLLYRHTIGSTCLMRRELFEQVGGFDPAFSGYEDWEFWLHALELGWHGLRVDEVTFEYRRHGATMLSGARRDYRAWYRRLRTKHAALYARRDELARESALGPIGRGVYRWWWGMRPMPAGVEHALHTVLWRAIKWRRPRRDSPEPRDA
jgi:glycosyltransferase involved in cell wall biosynthesis